MPKKTVANADSTLFQEAMNGVRPLEQDKIRPEPPRIKQKRPNIGQLNQQISQQSYYFSDEYSPLLPEEGPMRWLAETTEPNELKKLRRGQYAPEIFLDLHGLTQQQAKQELAAMLHACLKYRLNIASVMHGHGQNILKQRVPQWLAQHPDVAAFHQAPLEWGGNSALLILVQLPRN
ncbi:endonuclease SmrB [Celerinatantimonas yamalensis]|uniref:Ribosome rescue factor SmrB n=1 Tax=Celerinatantimonas yamalensis TaxID=559956 RepID=A0ABW9G1X5_9GAMM